MTIFAAVDNTYDENYIMDYYEKEEDAIARVERARALWWGEEVPKEWYDAKAAQIFVKRITLK